MKSRHDELLRPAKPAKAVAEQKAKPVAKPSAKPSAKPVAKRTAKPEPAAIEPRLSRQRKPPQLSADDWQRALRRQFGSEQGFELQNLAVVEKGTQPPPVFSEYRVSNADSGGHYRVAIRGTAIGDNLCTCPDFATNDLGTCKHVEFTLARLAAGVAARRRWRAVSCHRTARSSCTMAASARCASGPARTARPRCWRRHASCSTPPPTGPCPGPAWPS